MNDTSIPYHLVIPTVFALSFLIFVFINRKKLFKKGKIKWIWTCATLFFAVYFFIVSFATYTAIYYQWDLNKFDLNGDGFFSGHEITAEQKVAMNKLTNDIGRNFSFITGLILSALISIPVFIVGRMIERKNGTTHIDAPLNSDKMV